MKSYRFLLLIASLFFIVSCNEPEQRIARSVGATSEILVVTQNTQQWAGLQGEAIRAFLGQDQYGLPQSEPYYRISSITVDKLSDMFKKHRNLLVVEINSKLKEAVVETRSDLWAKPQRVVKIAAPDEASWLVAFEENKEGFKILYDRTERERLLNIFRPTANIKVMEPISEAFGIKLLVPEGYYIAKNENGFMWLRKETADFSQCLLLYRLPYRDTSDLQPSRIIKVRDSIVQQYIPGPTMGSYMTTDKEFLLPLVANTSNFVTDFAVETRGVWNLVGDFMAGPFLSYTVIDPQGNLLTLEGYVYAPNKPKRDQLGQLEAIMYSLEFEQKKEIQ